MDWYWLCSAAITFNKFTFKEKMDQCTLIVSSLYLVYALFNKFSIERDAEIALKNQGISANRLFTTPTPLNNWLWFIAG